jgi:ammonia channel protein AmtB
MGFHDAAGAGYIHMLGGACGFVGTSLLGPRSGIFDKQTVNKLVKAANMKRKIMNTNAGRGQDDINLYKSKKDNVFNSLSSSNDNQIN